MAIANMRNSLYGRIRHILEAARLTVARSVNTTQVVANWLIGREIIEEEQAGRRRAHYGGAILEALSRKLTRDFGDGYSIQNLRFMRQLYVQYPLLLGAEKIRYAARSESTPRQKTDGSAIRYAARSELQLAQISDAVRRQPWRPGFLHANLSWTHYRTLLRVEEEPARSFYEIEAVNTNWSARELERQITSLLYERLALSKDKKSLLRLAKKGHEVQKPTDIFKDPTVMEFLELPELPKLVETNLEQALIDNLQAFLLEMGKGFAFVSRQERITLDGDHFHIDLVFYHTILKCYVLIDLKVGKLTHQDLGQLQLYINYYDHERRTTGDQPTLGLILCTDKNESVVRYTLGESYRKNVFTSRYKFLVPTENELKTVIRRKLKMLPGPGCKP